MKKDKKTNKIKHYIKEHKKFVITVLILLFILVERMKIIKLDMLKREILR
jgi:hypothetical protein